MKNKKAGGKRKGAGRKKAADPKRTITIYVEQSVIDSFTGIDVMKSEIYAFLKKRGLP